MKPLSLAPPVLSGFTHHSGVLCSLCSYKWGLRKHGCVVCAAGSLSEGGKQFPAPPTRGDPLATQSKHRQLLACVVVVGHPQSCVLHPTW